LGALALLLVDPTSLLFRLLNPYCAFGLARLGDINIPPITLVHPVGAFIRQDAPLHRRFTFLRKSAISIPHCTFACSFFEK